MNVVQFEFCQKSCNLFSSFLMNLFNLGKSNANTVPKKLLLETGTLKWRGLSHRVQVPHRTGIPNHTNNSYFQVASDATRN